MVNGSTGFVWWMSTNDRGKLFPLKILQSSGVRENIGTANVHTTGVMYF